MIDLELKLGECKVSSRLSDDDMKNKEVRKKIVYKAIAVLFGLYDDYEKSKGGKRT